MDNNQTLITSIKSECLISIVIIRRKGIMSMTKNMTSLFLKVKTSIGNAPISKNEMEALITNHVKEYVLTNTWW